MHSFGGFLTKKGQLFTETEYIPYLGKNLAEAVKQADSPKIQLYTAALGYTGHPKILYVLEPYLEETKQVSQFQRLQMVLALQQLTKSYPKEARNVLYKIYQNPEEGTDVRVAAVYLLLRTRPPVAMLQRMAEYTNIDTNEQVNSAVKSSFWAMAELKQQHFNQ